MTEYHVTFFDKNGHDDHNGVYTSLAEVFENAQGRVLKIDQVNVTEVPLGTYELPVGNYYGMLQIRKTKRHHFWCVENHDGCTWKTCPQDVFDALFKIGTKI